ncbi:hypothetical protein EXIGLDRAFT_724876 [Exidia glandulosa HHB12029]|uniref:Uncharacterized protein n=1 Tax=Exidia glandulosa HHB12029 TaxID=1314781 RepID=A0A165E8Q1_EXIGL|nr:hypothetical protein EXIGLDRAFT_724876 [Exidia glandulosa HHB12029]
MARKQHLPPSGAGPKQFSLLLLTVTSPDNNRPCSPCRVFSSYSYLWALGNAFGEHVVQFFALPAVLQYLRFLTDFSCPPLRLFLLVNNLAANDDHRLLRARVEPETTLALD